MNWEAIGALAEILGAAAVVVTLVYLARQTRMGADAAISSSRSTSATAISELDRAIAQDPELARIVRQSMQRDPPEFSPEDWFRFTMFARSLIYLYEDQYLQSLRGTSDPEAGQIHLAAVIGLNTLPAWRRFWELETRGDVFRPEFTRAVNAARTTRRIDGDVVAGRD